jgi:hypothetical protein
LHRKAQACDQGGAPREQLGKAASAIGRIPFAGDAASSPLRSAGETAASIADAGAPWLDLSAT